MRFHGKRFGTGFWVLASALLAGSITCFSVAAAATTAGTTDIIDTASVTTNLSSR